MLMLYSSGPQPFWHQGWFGGIQFFRGLAGGQSRGGEDGFSVVQAHYIYCVLYDYYISSTSDHQALDGRTWGPLHTEFLSQARPMWNTIQKALMRDGDGIRVPHVIVRLSLSSLTCSGVNILMTTRSWALRIFQSSCGLSLQFQRLVICRCVIFLRHKFKRKFYT